MIVNDEEGRMPRGVLISFHSLLRESTDVNTEHQIAFGVACFLTRYQEFYTSNRAVASG
jgi:hypothetical protein